MVVWNGFSLTRGTFSLVALWKLSRTKTQKKFQANAAGKPSRQINEYRFRLFYLFVAYSVSRL